MGSGSGPIRAGAFDPLRKSGGPKCCDASGTYSGSDLTLVGRGSLLWQAGPTETLEHVCKLRLGPAPVMGP